MANNDIRNLIRSSGVCYWQVAEGIGIADSTFSRWLRRELPDGDKACIRDVIHQLTANKEV